MTVPKTLVAVLCVLAVFLSSPPSSHDSMAGLVRAAEMADPGGAGNHIVLNGMPDQIVVNRPDILPGNDDGYAPLLEGNKALKRAFRRQQLRPDTQEGRSLVKPAKDPHNNNHRTCDCDENPRQNCCLLKCINNPLPCAKAFGVPAAALDKIKEQTEACRGQRGMSWCTATKQCINPAVTECPGFIEERVNLIGGLAPGERCLRAAGYTWCNATSKCVQAWKTPCNEPQPHVEVRGMDDGSNGGKKPAVALRVGQKCYGASGYVWCDMLMHCIRPWEEKCPRPVQDTSAAPADDAASSNNEAAAGRPLKIGGKKAGERCLSAGGYSWCESSQKCQRMWEEPCRPGPPPAGRGHKRTCAGLGAGYSWCPKLNACALEPECMKAAMEAEAEESRMDGGGAEQRGGCRASLGYQWCQGKERCIQPWVESC